MVFTTEGFFELAIESLPEWDLNPRPRIPFSRSNRLGYQAMSSARTQSQLCTAICVVYIYIYIYIYIYR